jgi:hypothetical protein
MSKKERHPKDRNAVEDAGVLVGFTGTRGGMTNLQRERFRFEFEKLEDVSQFHHGDCIGADNEAADLCDKIYPGIETHSWPGNIESLRAHHSATFIHKAQPCLERNRIIVNHCDVLFACPKEPTEVDRSGTWATVRYARKQGLLIFICWPDGTVTEE